MTLAFNGTDLPVKNWRMRGGVDAAVSATRPWTAVGETNGLPAAFRTSFRANRPAGNRRAPHLPASPTRGSREARSGSTGITWAVTRRRSGVSSLYLPECWLTDGPNALTIFDETGAAPTQVQLITEMAASREIIRVDKPCDPATPMVVPAQDNAADPAR